jgi:hypothetical protein
MRGAIVSTLLVASMAACARSPRASHGRAPASVASPAPSASTARGAPTPAPTDAGADASPTAAPAKAHEDFQLVAVGNTWGAEILWLTTHGSRVWLSGRNVDAVADGDGPLTKQTDPLKGLPYQPTKHVLLLAGTHPHLYVLRYERREVPAQESHPVVFVRTTQGWIQARPLKDKLLPVAFLPWGEGALVVHSQIGPSIPAGVPSYSADAPGTAFEYVAPTGVVSDPKLGVDRRFMAWDADSDGATLSLLGTVVTDRAGADPELTIEVARGAAGTFERSVLFRTTDFQWAALSLARVREQGAFALVLPPSNNTELGSWKPTAQTPYVVRAGGHRAAPIPWDADTWRVRDAALDGTSLLVIEAGFASDATKLLRVSGETVEELVLPGLTSDGHGFRVANPHEAALASCEATKLSMRAPDDLWIQASCASADAGKPPIPAVFRRGHAQKNVVVLP